MCQTIAQRINREDEATGRVWESRYRAVRLLDEAALLACAAYIDLNPIRAAMALTLEEGQYTSVQRRIQALTQQVQAATRDGRPAQSEQVSPTAVANSAVIEPSPPGNQQSNRGSAPVAEVPGASRPVTPKAADRFLAPIELDELRDALHVLPGHTGDRCSDRGFLNMTTEQYIELLDWTARSLAVGKPGATPAQAPLVWQRLKLGISSETWLVLVADFGKLFKLVAGKPHVVDRHRGVKRPKRFKLSRSARELLAV